MKENQKSGKKSVGITLGIAVLMVALCAVCLNAVLAQAAKPDEKNVQSEAVVQSLGEAGLDGALQDHLDIIIYNNGLEPPAEGVTGQYAAAVMGEIAQRVYGSPLVGRVFVNLFTVYGETEGLYWSVQGEVADGIVSCYVNAATGADRESHREAASVDWAWFDTWNEEAAEEARIAAEAQWNEVMERDRQLLAEQPQPTEEQIAAGMAAKRQGMLDLAATMADKPHGAQAVALVNNLGIGDGAGAVSGAIMMEGSTGAPEGEAPILTYLVEVALDDGRYVVLTMDRETQELYGYERYEASLAETLYG